MRNKGLIILLLVGAALIQAAPLRIVSYNAENFFHPAHDTVAGKEKNDWEWTPEGTQRWSFTRYNNKAENIARVITNIGQWSGVDIIGLQEVENAQCLRKLSYLMRREKYGIVHHESPDPRGIDVALLYKKERVDTLSTKAIRIQSEADSTFKTRDILYVCAQIDKSTTWHLLVCHMPSQRGGKEASEWKRQAVRQALQHTIDSIQWTDPEARIIVMGDMNSTPTQDIQGLTNKMIPFHQKGKGTHKYQGQWTCLDQFYTSPNIDSISSVSIYEAEWLMEADEKNMGQKPKRTYVGYRYQNGFSDHLPIVMDIKY